MDTEPGIIHLPCKETLRLSLQVKKLTSGDKNIQCHNANKGPTRPTKIQVLCSVLYQCQYTILPLQESKD